MCTRAFIFADHKLKAVSAVKLLQYVIANLNLKELSFFCTYCKTTNLLQVIHRWKPGLRRIIILNSTCMLHVDANADGPVSRFNSINIKNNSRLNRNKQDSQRNSLVAEH